MESRIFHGTRNLMPVVYLIAFAMLVTLLILAYLLLYLELFVAFSFSDA